MHISQVKAPEVRIYSSQLQSVSAQHLAKEKKKILALKGPGKRNHYWRPMTDEYENTANFDLNRHLRQEGELKQ